MAQLRCPRQPDDHRVAPARPGAESHRHDALSLGERDAGQVLDLVQGALGQRAHDRHRQVLLVLARKHLGHQVIERVPREPAHHEDRDAHRDAERALHEIEHLPGIAFAEGQRIVPVRFRAGPRWRDSMIVGLPGTPQLRHLLDHGTRPVALPAEGLVMTDRLARRLGVSVGDDVDVDLLEGDYATRKLPLAAVLDEAFGLQAYARSDWLATMLREEPRVSALLLRVEADRAADARTRLKHMPEGLRGTS